MRRLTFHREDMPRQAGACLSCQTLANPSRHTEAHHERDSQKNANCLMAGSHRRRCLQHFSMGTNQFGNVADIGIVRNPYLGASIHTNRHCKSAFTHTQKIYTTKSVKIIMLSNSESLERAREEANSAFDEHCKQWDLLQKIANPTIDDLAAWLYAREALIKAQGKFEDIVRQISPVATG